MPGHMLPAECPCGFHGDVMPGVSAKLGMSHIVVAYDSGSGHLVTVSEQDAVTYGLQLFPNQYLNTGNDAPVSGDTPTFRCSKCRDRPNGRSSPGEKNSAHVEPVTDIKMDGYRPMFLGIEFMQIRCHVVNHALIK
jgi:hypothetical protein